MPLHMSMCVCARARVCVCALCMCHVEGCTHICRRWKASAHVKMNRMRKPGEELAELEARSAQRYIYSI